MFEKSGPNAMNLSEATQPERIFQQPAKTRRVAAVESETLI